LSQGQPPRQSQFPSQVILPRSRQTQGLILSQENILKTPGNRFGFGFGGSFRPGRRGFLPILLPLPGIFEVPKRRAKGKRKLKRQTSLISLPSQLGIELTGFSLEQERTGLVPRGLVAPKRKKKRRSQADLLF